jgi:hypothetical protein
MKFTSPVYSAVSGSIAGITYSHNRGGMYARARAIPVNPNTDPQVSARDAMKNGVVAWGTLTLAQRSAWEDYAANVPMLDRLGNSRPLTGQQQFLRTYLARSAAGAGVSPVLVAPTIFNLGTFTPFTGEGSAATDQVAVTFDDTDAWASVDGGFATIALGIQQGPGVNFYKSPFSINDILIGSALAGPTSPQQCVYGAPLTSGNKIWVKYVVGQADGRVSTPNIIECGIGA